MKKFRNYFILILAATVISSCSGLNKMKKNAGLVKYEVTPKVLETHAGLVNVTVDGVYPEKYFDKKTTLTATPVLVYEGGETVFKDVKVIQGEGVAANNQVITKSGGNFKYSGTVPYTENMKKSELILRVQGTRGGKAVDFDPIKLADGVIATSTLVGKEESRPIMMHDRFARIVPETQMADINYQINRSEILSKELKAEDIALLKEYIKAVNADPDREFKKTQIQSYASPDGKFELNEKLSDKRGTTADKFIKKEFGKVEAAKDPAFFEAAAVPEDWDGFKTEVENSAIQDKELILRVLSMYSDPEVREKEIKNMASTFEALKTDILPKLRRSKMIVNVDKIGRTDEQILSQMRSDPSVMSLDEKLYAATLTSDVNEQLKFYQATANLHPKCIRAQNNIGYTYMELGQVDNSIKAFEAAKVLQNNDVVKNNLGFASLAKGDMAKAEEYFNSMTAATPESRWGLGVIAITKGEYDKAVNYFGNDASYNLALALVLKGDVKKAKTTLDSLKEVGKTGKPAYLKAVVGARLDDRKYMDAGLRDAIAFDAKWKNYAKTDLEFAKFFDDATFKSTVQ
jgi:tetratricopeptide (TPR) repeat protein